MLQDWIETLQENVDFASLRQTVTGYWNEITIGLRVWAAEWGVPI